MVPLRLSRPARAVASVLALWLAACGTDGAPTPAPDSAKAATTTTAAPPPPPDSADPFAEPAPTASSKIGPVAADGTFACGALKCRKFSTAAEAFRVVLDLDKPLVLAIGESHAQKGSEGVRSTAARFTEEMLPALEGRASSLILELWVRDGKCGAKEEKVEAKQKEVTKVQADTNPNEFQLLGEKSKALGVQPFILRPTCEEYDQIIKAGDDAIMEMLGMITRNMKDKAEKLFAETQKKAPGRMVVTYGGSMHNDVAPREGRAQWSFAKDLDKTAGGKFTELDLVVPEFIKDTESWKSLPWYAAYDRDAMGGMAVLVEMGPRSYALVFPRSR